MISVFNNSDTLSEAFSLTVFTIALAAACKFDHIIFICRTKHLVLSWCGVLMRTFPWRLFLMEAIFGEITVSMFSKWSRLS